MLEIFIDYVKELLLESEFMTSLRFLNALKQFVIIQNKDIKGVLTTKSKAGKISN